MSGRCSKVEWMDVKKQLLSDPEVYKYYKDLSPKYQVIKQIIEQRKRLNMTQQDLARRLGTTQSVIARFESGNGNISLKTLERMSDVLGCVLNITIEPR